MVPICKDCNKEAERVNGKWKCPKCGKELKKKHISIHDTYDDEQSQKEVDFQSAVETTQPKVDNTVNSKPVQTTNRTVPYAFEKAYEKWKEEQSLSNNVPTPNL
ncbi:MAG: hypothetical protein K2G56_04985 [Eubacterium sp.]|nr:hypothetical protein [Eubacterium sp.]